MVDDVVQVREFLPDGKYLVHLLLVFGDHQPIVTSTKSLSGHALGAAGVHEAIYSLLMMQNDFIAASTNIEHMEPQAEKANILTETREGTKIDTILSNSFGFGGTNASLVMQRFKD